MSWEKKKAHSINKLKRNHPTGEYFVLGLYNGQNNWLRWRFYVLWFYKVFL